MNRTQFICFWYCFAKFSLQKIQNDITLVCQFRPRFHLVFNRYLKIEAGKKRWMVNIAHISRSDDRSLPPG